MNCQKSRGRGCYVQRHGCKNKALVHSGRKDTWLKRRLYKEILRMEKIVVEGMSRGL